MEQNVNTGLHRTAWHLCQSKSDDLNAKFHEFCVMLHDPKWNGNICRKLGGTNSTAQERALIFAFAGDHFYRQIWHLKQIALCVMFQAVLNAVVCENLQELCGFLTSYYIVHKGERLGRALNIPF